MAVDEGATNAEAREVASEAMKGRGKKAEIADSLARLQSQKDISKAEIASRERISGAEIAASRANAITAANSRQSNLSDLETMVYIMEKGTPEQKAALQEALKMKQQLAPSSYMDPMQAAMYKNLFPGVAPSGGSGGQVVVENGKRVYKPGG